MHDAIVKKQQQRYDILISADTIVVLDSDIIEKPRDVAHAHELLRSLSGRSHHVYTAVTILILAPDSTEPIAQKFVEDTAVEFGQLTDEQISAYVATGAPMYATRGFSPKLALLGEVLTFTFFGFVYVPQGQGGWLWYSRSLLRIIYFGYPWMLL